MHKKPLNSCLNVFVPRYENKTPDPYIPFPCEASIAHLKFSINQTVRKKYSRQELLLFLQCKVLTPYIHTVARNLTSLDVPENKNPTGENVHIKVKFV